ncbi:MAG: IS200/IS605 family transposase [Nitrososphaerota archaeon]|nr:IS200/IS605 family transposase [Nitrososphaerota archaeon]
MQLLTSVGSTFGEANYHLQFTPKYRRDVFLDEEVRALCRESFRTTCEGLGIGMEACEFGPDHVHLFVSGCRKCPVPYMAQRLKGASAYVIRHRLWDRVRGKLWGDSFWSDGYFYRSVGSTTAETVRYYVQNSQRKHWLPLVASKTALPQGDARGQVKLTDFS